MPAIEFFEPNEAPWTHPVDAYPPAVLPLIPEAELTGSRVKIHHRGTDVLPQLLEVQVDPDLELASHAHDASEIIVVVEGELCFGARTCVVGASVLVPGGTLYSVRAGPRGARFLNFRGAADYTYRDKAAHLERRSNERSAAPSQEPPAQPEPVGRFLVRCALDRSREEEIVARRDAHRAYALAHRHLIAFGGVISLTTERPQSICYILDVAAADDAHAFVDADPYAPLYAEVQVESFAQRVPLPAFEDRS